jgi:hypothetical protein
MDLKKKLPENKLRYGLVSMNFLHELGNVFVIPESKDKKRALMENSVQLGSAITTGLYCQCGRRTVIVDQSINGDGRNS